MRVSVVANDFLRGMRVAVKQIYTLVEKDPRIIPYCSISGCCCSDSLA